jgi:hypothetical protein
LEVQVVVVQERVLEVMERNQEAAVEAVAPQQQTEETEQMEQ